MDESNHLNKLYGSKLVQAIENEANPENLIGFVKNSECYEFKEWYSEITQGQMLLKKTTPKNPNMVYNLPSEVSPEQYEEKFNKCTGPIMDAKKKCIDKLEKISPSSLDLLSKESLGKIINTYIKEKVS
jgi:hypothetical protein